MNLEADVDCLLRRVVEARRSTPKEVVNAALRAGLTALLEPEKPRRRKYRLKPASLGRPRLPSLDNIGEVLAAAEGDRHR